MAFALADGQPASPRRGRVPHAPTSRLASLSLALLAGILIAFSRGEFPPIVSRDAGQGRSNGEVAGRVLEQSFVPEHDGLSVFEMTAGGGGATDLRLSVLDGTTGAVLASAEASGVRPGTPARFSFVPLSGVAGRALLARIEPAGAGPVRAAAWSHDGYAAGTLAVEGAPRPGDLQFHTEYTLLAAGVLWRLPGWTLAGLGNLV